MNLSLILLLLLCSPLSSVKDEIFVPHSHPEVICDTTMVIYPTTPHLGWDNPLNTISWKVGFLINVDTVFAGLVDISSIDSCYIVDINGNVDSTACIPVLEIKPLNCP